MSTSTSPGAGSSARPSVLSAYLALLAAAYRLQLQYRAAAVAGMVTQVFWAALKLMVLAAFYAQAQGTAPMGFSDVVAYVWLGQALFALLPWSVADDLVQQVRSGNVAVELLRPLDLYAAWFVRIVALRCARVTLRAAPIIVLAAVLLPLFDLERWSLPPPGASHGSSTAIAFAVSLVLSVVLSGAITMLIQVSLLYTISADGVLQIMPSAVMLLSGMVVPLPLFPEWLQPALRLQPFRGLLDVPFRVYTGHISANDAPFELAQQLLWCAVLIWLGRVLLARALRRVVIQGG
ncbi:MAG TPA: ABC-2 family transporter protein [Polyangiales bacterium]|nr:ABC-2 family transporter protein [Polyangiales bacterium]